MRLKPRPALLLYADDSGGPQDALRSVAMVSGPARVLLALERELRQALRLGAIAELKWAALRTRSGRVEAAQTFLRLAAVAMSAGLLRVDILIWDPAVEPKAWRGLPETMRLRAIYAQAWKQAVQAWPPGRWNVHPDRRTGMDWQQWPAALKARWRKGGGSLRALREAPSSRSACLQLADLLAGLARLNSRSEPGPGPGARALANRLALLDGWIADLQERRLGLKTVAGTLQARHARLHIRRLRRFPPLV